MPVPRGPLPRAQSVRNPRLFADRVSAALLALSALTLGGVAGEYLASGSARLWLANGGWTAGGLVAVVGVGVRTRRSARHERAGWALLLSASAAWLVGQQFWNLYAATSFPSSPNPADICWLVFAVVGAAGMHRLSRGASRLLNVSLLEVVPLIVAVSAAMVALLTQSLHSSQLSTAAQGTALAYPIFYVSAALVMLQAVLAGAVNLRRNPGLAAMLSGLVVNAIGFVLWAPQLLAGAYVVGGGPIDATWSVGMMLIGVGAWTARPLVALPDAQAVSRRRVGVLPALTFVLLAGVQSALNAAEGGADFALSIGLWVVGATLIAHASALRRRQADLLAQLHASERELRDANILLTRESRRDALTGLGNRLRLREEFADLAASSRRHGQAYCVVLIDLDGFKDYNDDHGHQAGDDVLSRIGELLNETVRKGERAYRYGGEELLLVLPGQDLDDGRKLAERQRVQLQRAALPHRSNAPHGVVTFSAGVAAAQRDETPEEVLRRADIALYEAKALGRNRVVLADPATTAQHTRAGAFSRT
jgi:diguanylate cyclase (GGDEF)-like protein